MSLRTAFELFLDDYPSAVQGSFAGHSVAAFIRDTMREEVEKLLLTTDRYRVKGSAGNGNWAKVPWLAVFDRLVTNTAQSGYYVVYLVKEDCSGVYLSLNQGVTNVRAIYGSMAKSALRIRADDFAARLGDEANGFIQGPIQLGLSTTSNLSSDYEQGNIVAKFYSREDLPSEEVLADDLQQLLGLYFMLACKEILSTSQSDAEDDEADFDDVQLLHYRQHKRIERNSRLAALAKKVHGYKCQACQFDFVEKYGELGKNYIEAHHLSPLSQLSTSQVKLNAKHDFAVLCANCHRMIHRSQFVSDVAAFRAQHILPLC